MVNIISVHFFTFFSVLRVCVRRLFIPIKHCPVELDPRLHSDSSCVLGAEDEEVLPRHRFRRSCHPRSS